MPLKTGIPVLQGGEDVKPTIAELVGGKRIFKTEEFLID